MGTGIQRELDIPFSALYLHSNMAAINAKLL